MISFEPTAFAATHELLDYLDATSILNPRRRAPGLHDYIELRAVCADVLAAAGDNVSTVKKLLEQVWVQRCTERNNAFHPLHILGKALNYVSTEAWAQRCENKYQSMTPFGTAGDRFMNAIYRRIPGTYGWKITRRVVSRKRQAKNRLLEPPEECDDTWSDCEKL